MPRGSPTPASQRRSKAEGKAELFARLLKLRFGALAPESSERLESASDEQLDTWAERVLTAGTLEAVFE